MTSDTDFEADLRGHLRDATDRIHAREGFWSEVAHRGRRRLRRRRIAVGASTVAAVLAVFAGVGMLLPSPTVPTIEPASPGDASDEEASPTSESEAEAQARAEAREEAEARRDEAEARRVQVEREAAERAAVETREQLLDRLDPAAPLPPITGYGDFSGVSSFELDPYLSTELVVRCILDAGFDVELAPPGDGILFNEPDPERNGLAAATAEACRAGLDLPDPEPATREQLEVVYAYHLAVHQCLTDEGLDLSSPASLERFLSDESWHPYADVPDALDASPGWSDPIGDWDEIQMRCPQQPVGGFGAWSPGDPVRSVEILPDLER